MRRPENDLDWPAIDGVERLGEIPFDEVPLPVQRRAYGVDYVQLDDISGGSLWVTRHGWRHLPSLDPAHWYFDQQFTRVGKRLADGSGAVYRVPGRPIANRRRDLVVKFSRVGQTVHLDVSSSFPGNTPRHLLDAASFNDPFGEFGLIEELRTGVFGPPRRRILTKRPLAVYSPGRNFSSWQLGRNEASFRRECLRLSRDQASQKATFEAIAMAAQRQYVTLFEWVQGRDLQQMVEQGKATRRQAMETVDRAIRDLARHGFRVLDMKPNHLIVRVRRDGSLLVRKDRLVYALVDFELLQRTRVYEEWRHHTRQTLGCGEQSKWSGYPHAAN